MRGWRYIAQRALTKEFLDLDLRIDVEDVSWALSGPGSLRASLPASAGSAPAQDGRPLIEEWSTLIYAEHSGQIRAGFIVYTSSVEDGRLNFEAAGFTAYPNGIPYTGNYSSTSVDPADVVGLIWQHVQSIPGGDLGVEVVGDSTPVRLGKPEVPAYVEVYERGAWVRKSDAKDPIVLPAVAPLAASMDDNDTTLTLSILSHFDDAPLPFEIKVGNERMTVTGRSGRKLTGLTRGVGSTDATGHNKGTKVYFTGTPTRTVEKEAAEPYALRWYEAPDVGAEIDSLAKSTPFDYTEEHAWSGDEIVHRVRISYPRTGTRRFDLAFRDGENITAAVPVISDGAAFANNVVGLGAGEGTKSVRRSTGVTDGRLRRVAVYTDKAVKTDKRMDAAIRAELVKRQTVFTIDSIDVRDHPNAPIGSWAVGDDVLVEVKVPHYGAVALWCRVTGWTLTSESTATLSLARSDSFTYGG